MSLTPKVKLAVLKDNLLTYRKEFIHLQCLTSASLDDLAHLAEDEVLARLSNGESLLNALSSVREWMIGECVSFGALQSVEEKYNFSKLFSNRLDARGLSIRSALLPEIAFGRNVALVRNRMIDDILPDLFANLNLTGCVDTSDFKEAISLVVDGETDFCILPHASHGLQQTPSLFEAVNENGLFLSLLLDCEDISLGFYGKLAYSISHAPEGECIIQILSPKDGVNNIFQFDNATHIERFHYRKETTEYFVDTFNVKSVRDSVTVALYTYLFSSHAKLIGFAQIIKV